MTDIHTHVLFNIDDGPETLEDSIALLKSCKEAGINTVVSTSHYYSARVELDVYTGRRERRINSVKEELEKENIDIKILTASEVHLTEVLYNLKDITPLCVEGTKHILLEIPYSLKKLEVALRAVETLISYFNINPIIAHIERYDFSGVSTKKAADRFRELGCLIQIDAEALVSESWLTKKKMLGLIKTGRVDFVASDCHGAHRPQNLHLAYEYIQKKIGKQFVDRLKENTHLMLENIPAEDIFGRY